MKKFSYIITCLLVFTFSVNVKAQQNDSDEYHRSSIYSILLQHPTQQFNDEIIKAFKSIPLPERYNDHNLKFRVMKAPIIKELSKEEFEGGYKDAILGMLNRNKIGGRIVEKWFNRDPKTGTFDMELIKQRGLYDADMSDIELAKHSVRGSAILEDAGEELLNHTYILVNDIRYADKTTKRNLQGFAMMAGLFGSVLLGPVATDLAKVAFINGIQINDLVVGFQVFVTSYLFRLDWNDEVAYDFYKNLWMDVNNIDANKKQLFKNKMSQFKLKYLGCTTVFSGKTSLAGVQYEEEMFKKVCTRAIDKSVSELQKSFDEFKVYVPLVATEPIMAYVGMKEDVDENTIFEVLEVQEDEKGTRSYNRIGTIKPIKDKIWDNRYMANFEDGYNDKIKGTIFEKVSGGDFAPGMIIREIKRLK